MDPMSVARRYFDSWNERNPAAIAACFREDGTYLDPATGGPLTGEAISRYAGDLFAAFPDVSFEVVTAAPAGSGMVAAQWMMRGTNTGPLFGGQPTNRRVTLAGADFIVVEGDRIRSVTGYFDQKAFAEQLGLPVPG